MAGSAKPGTAPDLSPEEKARRNAAIEQAWRIKMYLPLLERRVLDLEAELRETRQLIEDERSAHADLVWESTVSPERIIQRDEERAAAAA